MANIIALLVVLFGLAFTAAMGPTRLFRKPTIAHAIYGVVWMFVWVTLTLFAFAQLGLLRVLALVLTGQQ